MADTETDTSGRTPPWVKVQGTLVLLLILVVAAMSSGFLGIGGHGDEYEGPSDRQQHRGGH